MRPGQSSEPGSEAQDAQITEPIGVESIIEYVRMATSLIEGRFVRLGEIVGMLEKKGRQHSLINRRRMGYLPCQLNKGPP